ncbi:MAG: hypothetical protein M3419_08025 [Actinomycetota bacterium]|nr:hypothetical protein [Actinomycetota bacterium]
MTPDDRGKLVALSASGALLAAVLAPMRQHWRSKARDGFPLSYYPMFSARRKRHGTVTHLVGQTATGSRRLLHYSYAGTGGLNQVRRQLRRTVREGRAGDVAALVASRVATRPRRGDEAVTRVQVVTGRYAYDDFFSGQREPVSEEVHASMTVLRVDEQEPA